MPFRFSRTTALLAAAATFAACSNSSDNPESDIRKLIEDNGHSGDPSLGRNLPSIADPLAQLGKKLFFSKSLGGDFDAACVSCHHPTLGGGDDLALSIGVTAGNPDLLGPGRVHPDGEPTVPRNAPTVFNMGMWDQALFHDGRVESLGKTPGVNGDDGSGIRTPDVPFGTADVTAGNNLTIAQARFPVTSADELRGFVFESGNGNEDVRVHLAARLGDTGIGAGEISASNQLGVNQWLDEFQAGFSSSQDAETLITFGRVAEAIAAYENSQVFVDTPWRAWVNGDENAISPAAKRGAVLFFRDQDNGGANCASCHSGDFFTDEQFHVVAWPQFGHGKGDGDNGQDDFGRARETADDADRYKFRTPALLNVEVTGPYGHDGAFEDLGAVIRHHANPAASIDRYFDSADWCQRLQQFPDDFDCAEAYPNAEAHTRSALAQLEVNRSNNVENVLRDVVLTDDQVNDLVAFLLALTDPCVKDRECLLPWIADTNSTGPDGNQLNAVDADGNLL